MGNKSSNLVARYHCLVNGADKIILAIECWQADTCLKSGACLKFNSCHKIKALNYAYGLIYEAEIKPGDYDNDVIWDKLVNNVKNTTCTATFLDGNLSGNLSISLLDGSSKIILFGVNDYGKKDPNYNAAVLTTYRKKLPFTINR
jgi:hypothetical protein